MKQCSKCHKNKTFDKFYKNKRSVDGHSAYCKPCSTEYTRARRGSKRKYNKRSYISETHKECTVCQTIKPFSEFGKNRTSASGLHSWCKKCISDKTLEKRGGRVFKQLAKTETHKQCRICEQMKPYSEYAGKDSRSKQKQSYCIECQKFMGTERVLKRYGLTVETYMQLFRNQGGVCKICNKPEIDRKRLAVDHDHACCSGASSCGKCIRGLLCSKCNKALGMVSDDISVLESMIGYLKNF